MSISFEGTTCSLACWEDTTPTSTYEDKIPSQTNHRPLPLKKISIKQLLRDEEEKSPPPQLKCLNNYGVDLSGKSFALEVKKNGKTGY